MLLFTVKHHCWRISHLRTLRLTLRILKTWHNRINWLHFIASQVVRIDHGFCLTVEHLRIVVHHGLLRTMRCFLLEAIVPCFIRAFQAKPWTSLENASLSLIVKVILCVFIFTFVKAFLSHSLA